MNKNDLFRPITNPNIGNDIYEKSKNTVGIPSYSTPSIEGYDYIYDENSTLQNSNSNQELTSDGIGGWFSDSWKSFRNNQQLGDADNIRGKIVKDLRPELDELYIRSSYLKTALAARDAAENYLANPTEENRQLADSALTARDSLYKKYPDIINDYANANVDLSNELKNVTNSIGDKTKEIQEAYNEINELQSAVKERGKPSSEYEAIEANTEFEWFNPKSWLYKMPGTLGTSFSGWESQAKAIGSAILANGMRNMAMTYAASAGGPQAAAIANVIGWSIAVGDVAATVFFTREGRQIESNQEVYQAYKDKVINDLASAGIDLNRLTPQMYENLTGVSAEGKNIQEMQDDIISGNTPIKTERESAITNDILRNSVEGLDQVEARNMALGWSDIAQTAINFTPVRGLIGKALQPVTKVTGKITTPVSNAITNYLEHGISKNKLLRNADKFLKTNKVGIAVRRIGGATTKIGATAALEGMEEGAQYLISQDYANKKINEDYSGFTGELKGLLDNIGYYSETAKAMLGISGNQALMNDNEFFQNIKAGAMMGTLFGGIGQAIHTPRTIYKEIASDNYIRNLTADQLLAKDDMIKAEMYADLALKGKKDYVLSSLDKLKYIYPKDVLSEEEIEAEKKRAKRIIDTATSPAVTSFINEISKDGYGTEDHKILTGLVVNAEDRLNIAKQDFNNALAEEYAVYNNKETNDYVNDLTNDNNNTDLIKSIVIHKARKKALSSLVNLTNLNSKARKLATALDNMALSDKSTEIIDNLYNRLKTLNNTESNVLANLKKEYNETDEAIPFNDISSPVLTDAVEAEKKFILTKLSRDSALEDWASLLGYKVDFVGNNYRIKHHRNYKGESKDALIQTALDKIEEYRKAKRDNLNTTLKEQRIGDSNKEIEANELPHNHLQGEPEQPVGTIFDGSKPESVVESEGLDDNMSKSDIVPITQDSKGTATQNAKTAIQNAEEKNFIQEEQNLSNEDDVINNQTNNTDDDILNDLFGEAEKLGISLPNDEKSTSTKEENLTDDDILSEIFGGELEAVNTEIRQANEDINKPTDTEENIISEVSQDDTNASNEIVTELNNDTKVSSAIEAKNDVNNQDDDILNEMFNSQKKVDELPVIPKPLPTQEEIDNNTVDEDYKTQQISAEEAADESTEEKMNSDLKANENVDDSPVIDVKKDRISHKLIVNPNIDTPLKSGYENGKAFLEFMSNPNALDNVTIDITVEKWRKGFDVNNPLTYNDAAIYIHIIDNTTGKKYIAAISDPNRLITTNRSEEALFKPTESIPEYIPAYSEDVINNLIQFRAKIIQLYYGLKPGQKLTVTKLIRTAGRLNSKQGNKSILHSKLIGDIKDIYDIDSDKLLFGIGKGLRYGNSIVNKYGNVLYGNGGSGTIYLYPKLNLLPIKVEAMMGFPGFSKIGIKLNPLQFKQHRDIAEVILDFAVNRSAAEIGNVNSTPFNPLQALQFIVNFGNKTLLDEANKIAFPWLINKQFARTEMGDGIILGNKVYKDVDINTNPAIREEAINFIMQNQHFAFDKDFAFGYIHQTVNNLQRWFIINQKERLELVPNKIFFDLQDVGLTKVNGKITYDDKHPNGLSWIAWAAKNDLLLTDIGDPIWKNPFTYVEDVTVEDLPAPTTKKIIQNNSTPKTTTTIKKSGNPFDRLNKKLGASMKGVAVEEKDKLANQLEEANDIKKMLGSSFKIETELSDQEIRDIYDLTKTGTRLFGLTLRDSILLFNGAIKGTGYHEAFHRVSLLLLSPSERNRIYNEYRKNNNLKLKTNEEVEELLAEDFREYVLNRVNTKDIGRNNLFKRLYNFVRTLTRLKNWQKNHLFKNIVSGKFKDNNVNLVSEQYFSDTYGDDGAPFKINGYNFKTIHSVTAFYNIVNALKAYVFVTNNINTIQDIDNIENPKIIFDEVYNIMKESIEDYSASEDQIEVRKEIVEKYYDIFVPEIKKSMSSTFLRVIDKEEVDRKDKVDSGDAKGDTISAHILDSTEISKKDNALGSVKIFISTIINSKFGENNELEQITDPLTGLPTFFNFDLAWNTLIRDLHNCETYTEIEDRINKLAETKPFYKALSNKLKNTDDDNFKTQFYQTMKSHIHQYVQFNYTKSKKGKKSLFSGRIFDSNLTRAIRAYPRIWASAFFSNDKLFTKNLSKEPTPNKAALESIIDDYNKLVDIVNNPNSPLNKFGNLYSPDNLYKFKQAIVNLLNNVGIFVDVDTIDSLLHNDKQFYKDALTEFDMVRRLLTNENKGSLSNLFTNILNAVANEEVTTITTKKGKTITYTNQELFVRSSIVVDLAKQYAKIHPSPEESSVLGANGAVLFETSQNCYLTDQVRWLNQDDNTISKLKQVVYNYGENGFGSHVLNVLDSARRNGEKIKLNVKTFINFVEESSGDKGRDYVSITPLEDYVAKMSLVRNDYIIAPTLADKKTYFVIQGIPLFHEGIMLTDNNTFDFGQQTTDQFIEYAYAELAAIKRAANDIKTMPERDLVKNYHIGKNARGEGNGLRFRYFNGIYMNTDKGMKFIDFNKILDEANSIEDGIAQVEEMFFNIPSEDPNFDLRSVQRAYINDLLYRAVWNELCFAEELGLIKFKNNDRNIANLENIALDDTVLQEQVNKYKKLSRNEQTAWLIDNANAIAIMDMIADYTINSIVSITEFEKIFSKDPAYHKDTDAKIKRLTALSSTGDNLRIDWPVGHELDGRTTFTVSELKDNKVYSSFYDTLHKLFYDNYKRDFIKEIGGVDEATAIAYANDEQLAIDNLGKEKYDYIISLATTQADFNTEVYKKDDNKAAGKINQADAAVYIRPKMYKDILQMLGEWNDDVRVAFEYLEQNDDSWLSDPVKYNKAIKAVIKPLKMMYFGDTFLPEYGLDVPIFDKMAIFPLFHFMANGDLRDLYNRMNDENNPIDMVTFESAVKVGNRKAMKHYKNADMKEVNDLNNMEVYTQEFKYLRRQLITDPHHASEINAGTQFIKTAMANLIPDRVYREGKTNERKGEELAKDYFNTINELSNKGVTELLNTLGAEIVDNDIVIKDYTKLLSILREDAKNSNMSYSVIDALTPDENGQIRIPLPALADMRWLESRLVSLINSYVIDIKTPGNAFIQMSSFGLKSISSVDGIVNYINNGNPLRYYEDGAMDSVVSITLFKDVLPSESKEWSFFKKREWLLNNNIIGPNTYPCALGYRIPTQGLGSISALRIVDILPENMGDVIVLPDEFTALTGSDFDIDKLYVARFNYDKSGKKIEYDRNKSVSDNSSKQLQNLLLDTFIIKLTDEKSVGETRMPLDVTTDTLKGKILGDIEREKQTEQYVPYRYVSPKFQSDKKNEYTTGKLGIGPFALNNAHHVLTQLTNLNFKYNPILNVFGINSLSGIYGVDNKRILDWLSALINAFVDIAKDPYIVRLNVVQWTYNMANMLLRSGKGESTFYFLSQPILKDMASAVDKTKGRYGTDDTKSANMLEKEAINSVYDKYYNIAKSLANKEQANKLDLLRNYSRLELEKKVELLSSIPNIFSVQWEGNKSKGFLADLIHTNNSDRNFDWYYNQLFVYTVYDALTPAAKVLAELVHNSQIDTKKYGNNFTLFKMFKIKVSNMFDTNKLLSNLVSYWKKSFLETKFNNSVILGRKIFKDLLLTTSSEFSDAHLKMMHITGNLLTTSENIVNRMSNVLESSIKLKYIRNYALNNSIDIYSLFYGDNTIAVRLSKLRRDIHDGKYPELLLPDGSSANTLINILEPVFRSKSDTFDKPESLKINKIGNNDVNLADSAKRYWEELFDSNNDELRTFARDLAVYAMIASGDNKSINSINNLIPDSFKQDIGYTDYIRDSLIALNNKQYGIDTDDVFINNWFDDYLVREIDEQNILGIDSPISITYTDNNGENKLKYPLLFVVTSNVRSTAINKVAQPLFAPYVKISLTTKNNPNTTVLYKLIGYSIADGEGEEKPIYIAINKKGVKDTRTSNLYTEYNVKDSILSFNKLPLSLSNRDLSPDYLRKVINEIYKLSRHNPIALNTIRNMSGYFTNNPVENVEFYETMETWDSEYHSANEGEEQLNTNESTFDESARNNPSNQEDLVPDTEKKLNIKVIDNSTEIEDITKYANYDAVYVIANLDENGNIVSKYDKLIYVYAATNKPVYLINMAKPYYWLQWSTNDSRFTTVAAPSYADNSLIINELEGLTSMESPYGLSIDEINNMVNTLLDNAVNKTKIRLDDEAYETAFNDKFGERIEYQWSLGNPEGYDISMNGDNRYNAENAIFDSGTVVDWSESGDDIDISNMSIAEVFDMLYTGTGNLPKVQQSLIHNPWADSVEVDQDFAYHNLYLKLYQIWAKQNPQLINELAVILNNSDNHLTDLSYSSDTKGIAAIINAPRALTDILDDYDANMRLDLKEKWTYEDLLLDSTNDVTSTIDDWTFDDLVANRVPDIPGYTISSEEFDKTINSKKNTVTIGEKTIDLSAIGIPFALNQQQTEALNNIASWLTKPIDPIKGNPCYTLVGYAGTGKTTIMRVLLEHILKNTGIKAKQIALVSPTNKAASVLSSVTDFPAFTIHALLGLSPTINIDEYKHNEIITSTEFSADRRNNMLKKKLVIIDEVSMVNDDLFKDLITIAREHQIKLLTVGDKAQLQPVKQNRVGLAFFNPMNYALTKVERQKGTNPLLPFLDYIRSIFTSNPDNVSEYNYKSEFDHMSNLDENGNGILFVSNSQNNQFLQSIADTFNTELAKQNNNYVKALAWTNKRVNEINTYVRSKLGYTDHFNPNEPITMYDTIELDENDYLFNSMDYSIESSEPTEKYIPFLGISLQGYNVKIKLGDSYVSKPIFVVTDDTKSSEIAEIINNKLINLYQTEPSKRDIKLFFDEVKDSFYSTFDMVTSTGRVIKKKTLDYGYASTVHKSQGSTYNIVFVDEADINKNNSPRNRSQLKYTAFSRASESAVVLTNNNILPGNVNNEISEFNKRKLNISDNNVENGIKIAEDGLTTPGVVNGKNSANLLISDIDRIPSNEEIRNLRKIYNIDFKAGDRILAATERTDPAMFSNDILDMLKNNRDKIKALYIITKHDGLPIKRLLQDPTPKFIHFSITGLGDKIEPGVMKYNDLLDKIGEYIKEGLDPNIITIRIDPLVPGLNIDGKTGEISDTVKRIIDKALSIGITQFRTSMIDGYKSTVRDMKSVNYDFSNYPDAYDMLKDDEWKFWSPKRKYIEAAFTSLSDYLTEKYIQMGIDPNSKTLHLCGEPIVMPNRPNKVNIQRIGCVNTKIMMDILGLKDITAYDRSNPTDFFNDRVEPLKQATINVSTDKGLQEVTVSGKDRKNCYCAAFKNEKGQIMSTKIDAAAINPKKCMSMCAYCYMAMSEKENNKPIRYYDENGNLRDFDFTRTTEKPNIGEINQNEFDDSIMKHCKEE